MEWISGNIFIRPHGPVLKGQTTTGHKHAFDHTTVVLAGAVRVRAVLDDGKLIERHFGAGMEGGRHFLVRAGVEHEITALVDGTEYWCIYSHRDPQGEVIEHYDGWEAAYR
jgi:hypothetical protein